jgi:hypothetical protein
MPRGDSQRSGCSGQYVGVAVAKMHLLEQVRERAQVALEPGAHDHPADATGPL